MQKTVDEILTSDELSPKEIERYSRHLVIPEVGPEGQQKLKSAKVLMIGAGGLGSPVGMYLTAAGIGKLGIVDFDTVSFSNLQRQVIYSTEDVGKSKAELARERLNAINPNVEIEIYDIKLTKDNALEIIKDYDIVADGSDNFATRYLVNDACVLLGKPFVYASILRFEGQVSFFNPKTGPCYRCLYPEPPRKGEIPSCEEGGVIGAVAGIIGSIQANEVIKYIIGKGELLIRRLLILDALKMKFKEIKFEKDPDCPVCSDSPLITELIDYEEFCKTGTTKENKNNMSEGINENPNEITVEELKERIDKNEKVNLLDVRPLYETEIATIGGITIPINSLMDRLGEIEKYKEEELIVYCHSGINSYYAAEYLKQEAGFKNVKNLAGGISEWADKIDPSMQKY